MEDVTSVTVDNSMFYGSGETDSVEVPAGPPKVLVISYYFPPMGLSGVQRTLKFVKYLPEFNWQPIVLTTGATKYYAYDDSLLSELPPETAIYRTAVDPFRGKSSSGNKLQSYPSAFKQRLGRLFLQSLFIPDSRSRWRRPALALAERIFAEHPDISLIFATAPPFTDFLIAKELSEQHNIPFIVDYRDLWSDNPQYFFPTPYHRYRHLELEYDVLRNCRKITVITRTMKEKLLSRYKFLSYDDVSIIPHGFDAADFIGAQQLGGKAQRSRKLVITHSGLFPDDRTPKPFLKALSRFLASEPKARQSIELRFVGIMRKKHIKLLKRYKLDDITVLTGYLPHLEAVRELQHSDVLWMMLYNSVETPGRLFEYIGSEKPLLLLLPDGALKQIGQDYGASFIVSPQDIVGITGQIKEIYKLWHGGRLPRPSNDYVKLFERRYLTSVLSKEMLFTMTE